MSRQPGQPEAAAVAAGSGVAHPPGGQNHSIPPVFPAVPGADPNGFPIFQEDFLRLSLDDLRPCLLGETDQGVGDVPGVFGDGKDPAAPLGFQGDSQGLEQLDGLRRGKGPQGAVQKLGVAADVFLHLLRRAVVGKVAPALAGDQDLPGGALPALHHQDRKAAVGGGPGAEEAGGSPTDDDGVCCHRLHLAPSVFS